MYRLFFLPLFFCIACQSPPDKPVSKKEQDFLSVLSDAYIFAYPLVLMDLTRKYAEKQERKPSPNLFFHHRHFPDPTFKMVVKPNLDTYYSTAWLNLKEQPVVLSLPKTDRYFLVPLYDAWTNVFAAPGTRTTGAEARDFLIAGPHWKGIVPDGMQLYRSPTNMVYAIGRIQVNNPEDGSNVVTQIQDRLALTPLDQWTRKDKYTANDLKLPLNIPPPKEQLKKLRVDSFFNLFNRLLEDNPPYPTDQKQLSLMKVYGIGSGKHFSLANFPDSLQERILQIPIKTHQGFPKLYKAELINGWRTLMGLADYGIDYKKRAFVAHFGLGANWSEDTVYPTSVLDAEGTPFHGKNNYRLHFPKGQLPPAQAFWSITMYNAQYFLVPNPIDRYAIGDRDDLLVNEDGSLDIWIQHESPAPEKRKNWLPAPKETFTLTLRIYWPEERVLTANWNVPPVEKINQ